MADVFTSTTKTSYWSRLWNALKWIIGWFVLLWASIFLLWWNENNYVEQKAALDETKWLTVETTADAINPDLDWQVVYVSWKTSSPSEEALVDELFWVKTDDLKLIRNVEMYQWVEEQTSDTEDNLWWSQTTTTKYTYHKEWSSDEIDSSNFEHPKDHENPVWNFHSETYTKDPIMLGVYDITQTFGDRLDDTKSLNLSGQEIREQSGMIISDYNIYIWKDANKPEVWDMRIKFETLKPGTVSVVAEQHTDTLIAHTTTNGRNISLISESDASIDWLFDAAYSSNTMLTWLLRFLWIFGLWMWFSMIFSIFEALAKIIPFLWNLVWWAVGLVCLGLALIVWLTTIAIAWLVVRPVIWLSVLAVVIIVIIWMITLKKRKWWAVKSDKDVEIIEA